MRCFDRGCAEKDGVSRHAPACSPGREDIGIDVEFGEIRGGDVQTQAMAFLEQVGGSKGRDRDPEDFTLGDRLRVIIAARIVSARRVDVDELGREIGIGRIGGNPEGYLSIGPATVMSSVSVSVSKLSTSSRAPNGSPGFLHT